jgi:hypothetical protein
MPLNPLVTSKLLLALTASSLPSPEVTGIRPDENESQSLERAQINLSALEFDVIRSHLSALERESEKKQYKKRRCSKALPIQSTLDWNNLSLALEKMMPEKPLAVEFAMNSPKVQNETEEVEFQSTGAVQVQVEPTLNPQAQVSQTVASSTLNTQVVRNFIPFVEAFHEESAVEGVQSQMYTVESNLASTDRRGWQMSSSDDHWSTLSWIDSSMKSEESVPLLLNNTVQLLGHLTGVSIDPNAGIIFGKVAAGWEIEFSGTAAEPIYLDSQLQKVSPDAINTDRYFAFTNVSVGAHLIYVTSKSNQRSGAVAAPVLAGTGTYLDLTQYSVTRLAGQVFQGGNDLILEEEQNLSYTTVRVIGQPDVAGMTDSEGKFNFDQVLTISNYPLFVETDRGAGFTHRYKVLPSQMDHLTLNRIPVRVIHDWLGQLEGGVNNQSGLVVASLSKMIQEHPELDLFPSIHTLNHSSNVGPETYTLSPTSELRVGTPLQALDHRFIGVEIPEGAVIVQAAEKNNTIFWSELTIASPGVINVIGPY